MNHELGNAYLGQLIAKQAMYEAMNKPKAKKTSFFKRMMKKMAK